MSDTPGVYSLIQYMPDACTQEAATIGVLVLDLILMEVAWGWDTSYRKPTRYFDLDFSGLHALDREMIALEENLIRHRDSDLLSTGWDIDNFAKTLCNNLRMTPCRGLRLLEGDTPQSVAEAMTQELTFPVGFDPEGPPRLH